MNFPSGAAKAPSLRGLEISALWKVWRNEARRCKPRAQQDSQGSVTQANGCAYLASLAAAVNQLPLRCLIGALALARCHRAWRHQHVTPAHVHVFRMRLPLLVRSTSIKQSSTAIPSGFLWIRSQIRHGYGQGQPDTVSGQTLPKSIPPTSPRGAAKPSRASLLWSVLFDGIQVDEC
jgi:hypothetical protein